MLDFNSLPQEEKDVAYVGTMLDHIRGSGFLMFRALEEVEAAARTQLVGKVAKYYPEIDQLYCPECGAKVNKYQCHCGYCGQKLDGTHDGIKPEIIYQEPDIDNETGEVDWGEEE